MATHNIKIRKKNGANWDILYPLTLASNVTANNGKTVQHELDTIFNKVATTTQNGAMSSADKSKLNGIEANANKYVHPNNSSTRHVTDTQISLWNDKYTKLEIDNKFNEFNTGLDWKESVSTFNDIATTYPNPDDGWTVNTKDTDITYRYTGSEWIAISANAIPLASQSVDGKMSKADKKTLDGLSAKVIDLEAEIGSITGGIGGDLSGLSTRVDAAENNIKNLNTKVGTLKTDKADVDHNHDDKYASKGEFESIKDQISQNKPVVINNDTPIGTIVYRDKDSSVPTGWLICNGRQLSTTEYSDLFKVIGYKHGGSGKVFNLPKILGNDIIINTDNGDITQSNTLTGQVVIIKAKSLSKDMISVAQEVEAAKGSSASLLDAINKKLDKTGGTITGSIIANNNVAYQGLDTLQPARTRDLIKINTTNTLVLGWEGMNSNPKVWKSTSAYELYHQGNKPTAKEIGAVASSETTLINGRNSKHRMLNANANGYPTTALVIDDLDNTNNSNGLYYLLGNGVSGNTNEHNSLRPKNVNSSNKNCLGQITAPWDELYLKGKALSGNGYSKLPNGLILQWGTMTRVDAEARAFEIYPTFPISFPTKCITVVCTVGVEDAYTNTRNVSYYAIPQNNNNFKIRGYAVGEYMETVKHAHINWIAIGY